MAFFFTELSIVMVVVLLVSLVMRKIKQPLLIGYIIAGLVAGPLFFNFLTDGSSYEAFAHIGVAFLLFIVGLSLNVSLIREVGIISLITGIGQVVFTSLFGFLTGLMLGFSVLSSLIIAIGLTFSSTIIIIKLLSDKKDLDSLYGKIALGFLLVQDFVAVILLMFVGSLLTVQGDVNLGFVVLKTVLFGLFSVILTVVLAKYIVPRFMKSIANSQELLFIFVIAWVFGFATLFNLLGFSLEIGALLAGISLASSPYVHEITAKVKPLRDFFIVMFFILLGSQMIPEVPPGVSVDTFGEKIDFVVDSVGDLIGPALIFSIFVLVGNPLIVFALMSFLGYSSRTGFLAGLTVAQISEFSLILGIMAQQAGLISSEEIAMLTFVGIITITASTYLIMNGNKIYHFLSPVLKQFERKRLKDAKKGVRDKKCEILIFGANRIGYSILKSIQHGKQSYLVVDNDPNIVEKLNEKHIHTVFGDVSNVEFLEEFKLKEVKLLISTIPDKETNLLILETVRSENKNAQIILTASHVDNALELYERGADYVILPHFLGGEYVAQLIGKMDVNVNHLLNEKIKHINELKDRKNMGHEHPTH